MAQTIPENCPFPLGGPALPSNTWFLWPTRIFIQNGISINSAVFAQLTVECPIILQWATTFPLKIAPSPWGSVPRAYPSHHPKWNLDRLSRFCMGPKCYVCCTMHCQWKQKPLKLPLPLGILWSHQRKTEPRWHATCTKNCYRLRTWFGSYARRQIDTHTHTHTDRHYNTSTHSNKQSN